MVNEYVACSHESGLDAFFRQAKRRGLSRSDFLISQLIDRADRQLFKLIQLSHHCLNALLPSSHIISYHIITYQGFLVRPLLREPRPQVHYKSQPDAKAQRETQKSTNVKSLTKIE